MVAKKQDEEKPINHIKLQLFNWTIMSLLGLLLWQGKEIHSDVKNLNTEVPMLKLKVGYLEDYFLKLRFQIIPPIKHEDPITYDSLIKN